jgi:D-alanyl-D-alanine carboxypeptidase
VPANVDAIVEDVLAETGVPSASVAVVRDGKIIYTHAYGDAQIAPAKRPATPAMRYSVGSISKQFTATALLLLAEQGKLSLDDAIGKYVPGLTRGDEVTIRQVLSHTSGYPDYAPQDYMIPEWTVPTTAEAILDHWAKLPLDFDPGTKWQYSNTNYVIAGLVCAAAAGMPLRDFLEQNIFAKLGMHTVTDDSQLTASDAIGYFRRAAGPLHASDHMGKGWLFSAGDLAMTAQDLATWDIALIDGTILSPASTKALETETVLANGAGTGYGLGVDVAMRGDHRQIEHGGEAPGFVAENIVLPDDKLAVVVLTNQDASNAAGTIGGRIRDALFKSMLAPSIEADRRARAVLEAFARGAIDRTMFTANANAYFTPAAIREYANSLVPLGALTKLELVSTGLRGGFTSRRYTATYAKKHVQISTYETAEGKLEQFLLIVE